MKKRVRLLPLFLAVVLSLSLLSGCGRKKPGPEAAAEASSAEASSSATVSATVEATVSATLDAAASSTESAADVTSVETAIEAATEADASTGRTQEAEASFKSATGTGGAQKIEYSKTDATTDSIGIFNSGKVDVQVEPVDKVAHPTDESKKNSSGKTDTSIDENGTYSSKDEVALYIHTYGKLPSNFITKKEANALGWSGGSLEKYAPGKAIGGDKFGNYEGLLPTAKGRKYYECDIDTLGKSKRGAKRIIYSSDGLIFYTSDHYESFEQLY